MRAPSVEQGGRTLAQEQEIAKSKGRLCKVYQHSPIRPEYRPGVMRNSVLILGGKSDGFAPPENLNQPTGRGTPPWPRSGTSTNPRRRESAASPAARPGRKA